MTGVSNRVLFLGCLLCWSRLRAECETRIGKTAAANASPESSTERAADVSAISVEAAAATTTTTTTTTRKEIDGGAKNESEWRINARGQTTMAATSSRGKIKFRDGRPPNATDEYRETTTTTTTRPPFPAKFGSASRSPKSVDGRRELGDGGYELGSLGDADRAYRRYSMDGDEAETEAETEGDRDIDEIRNFNVRGREPNADNVVKKPHGFVPSSWSSSSSSSSSTSKVVASSVGAGAGAGGGVFQSTRFRASPAATLLRKRVVGDEAAVNGANSTTRAKLAESVVQYDFASISKNEILKKPSFKQTPSTAPVFSAVPVSVSVASLPSFSVRRKVGGENSSATASALAATKATNAGGRISSPPPPSSSSSSSSSSSFGNVASSTMADTPHAFTPNDGVAASVTINADFAVKPFVSWSTRLQPRPTTERAEEWTISVEAPRQSIGDLAPPSSVTYARRTVSQSTAAATTTTTTTTPPPPPPPPSTRTVLSDGSIDDRQKKKAALFAVVANASGDVAGNDVGVIFGSKGDDEDEDEAAADGPRVAPNTAFDSTPLPPPASTRSAAFVHPAEKKTSVRSTTTTYSPTDALAVPFVPTSTSGSPFAEKDDAVRSTATAHSDSLAEIATTAKKTTTTTIAFAVAQRDSTSDTSAFASSFPTSSHRSVSPAIFAAASRPPPPSSSTTETSDSNGDAIISAASAERRGTSTSRAAINNRPISPDPATWPATTVATAAAGDEISTTVTDEIAATATASISVAVPDSTPPIRPITGPNDGRFSTTVGPGNATSSTPAPPLASSAAGDPVRPYAFTTNGGATAAATTTATKTTTTTTTTMTTIAFRASTGTRPTVAVSDAATVRVTARIVDAANASSAVVSTGVGATTDAASTVSVVVVSAPPPTTPFAATTRVGSTTTTTSTTSKPKPKPPKVGANNVPGYLKLVFETTVADVCETSALKETLFQFITRRSSRVQSKDQVVMMIDPRECQEPSHSTKSIPIALYVVDEFGVYDKSLIDEMKTLLEENHVGNNTLPIHEIVFRENVPNTSRVIAATVITSVAAVCFVLLVFLMCAIRNRQKSNYGQRCTPVSVDDYNLDNISEYNSVRRRGLSRMSKRSYGNPSFDDPVSPSKRLTLNGLSKAVENRRALDEEFSRIPTIAVKAEELPPGVETKNRYANVIPLPETRVSLDAADRCADSADDYINANYVKGFDGADKFYIACQAPLPDTIRDFWRMVWKERTKVVVMLTALDENGVEKCADYLPPSEVSDCHRIFGEFRVTLKKREVKEKYVVSSLQLKNTENNSRREVTHVWYTSWPARGVPEEASSIIALLIEARAYTRNSGGAYVVHCSPGTGRTGVVIAVDACIRDYESTRTVDVPSTVAAIRRCRAGAVQTKDQYAFVYKVLALYAKKLNGGTSLDSM